MKIDFTSDLILENERALLRPLRMEDYDDLLYFSLNEPNLWKYSLLPGNGKENLKTYISIAIAERENERAYPLIVIDKSNNSVAGSTRFYDYQASHNTIQLGYTWYGEEYQGTGLNKNCKYLLLKHAFEEWQLDRVEFRADNKNKRSIQAMKSIGCIEEGVLRSNCSSLTGRRDSIVLSILKSEWREKVKDNLIAKIK